MRQSRDLKISATTAHLPALRTKTFLIALTSAPVLILAKTRFHSFTKLLGIIQQSAHFLSDLSRRNKNPKRRKSKTATTVQRLQSFDSNPSSIDKWIRV